MDSICIERKYVLDDGNILNEGTHMNERTFSRFCMKYKKKLNSCYTYKFYSLNHNKFTLIYKIFLFILSKGNNFEKELEAEAQNPTYVEHADSQQDKDASVGEWGDVVDGIDVGNVIKDVLLTLRDHPEIVRKLIEGMNIVMRIKHWPGIY